MNDFNKHVDAVVQLAQPSIDPELAPLLDDALTAHYASQGPLEARLKIALLNRVVDSKAKGADKVTVRHNRLRSR